MAKPSVRFGLLGFGNVGRQVVLNNADRYHFNFHWIADSRNLVSKANGFPFTDIEMRKLVKIKDQHQDRFGEKCRVALSGAVVHEYENIQEETALIAQMIGEPRKNWVIIDATTLNGEVGKWLVKGILGCACYCTANKNPWADFDLCAELYQEAQRAHTLLGLNCVVGVWVDQMEILPIVMKHLRSGRLSVVKRDNSSLNLFFEKVGSGVPADVAIATIAASGHLEPGALGLESEVRDQELKARIAANIIGLLTGFKIDFSGNIPSRGSSSSPKSLDPSDIGDWHKSGREKRVYPALTTEINVETTARKISCAVNFDALPRYHPLARDFGGKSAILIQPFDGTEFEWTHQSGRKRSGRFVHTGFGGGPKTAEKLLWEANRAVELVKTCSMSTFTPIPILWALANQEPAAKRLEKELENSL